jgi:hypothetical protein
MIIQRVTVSEKEGSGDFLTLGLTKHMLKGIEEIEKILRRSKIVMTSSTQNH